MTSTPRWATPEPTHRLVVDGADVGPAWEAVAPHETREGLLGTDAIDGALLIRRCPSVHTVRMRYPIDVAFLAKDGRVLARRTMRPWRLSRIRWRAADTLEAPAGAFDSWGLHRGSHVTVRPG